MFRLYNFECAQCGTEREGLVDVPFGTKTKKAYPLECEECGGETSHVWVVVAPFAKPTCDLAFSPRVSGGKFDTLGNEPLPALPTLPDGAKSNDYKDLFAKPEYKEIRRERREVKRRNLQKRKRAYMMDRGENVSVRQNKLPGDPKF